MELYATAFDRVGKLDKLEAFASLRGPDFYGLPRNQGTITLRREPFAIPQELSFGDESIVPLAAGESLPWSMVDR
jgi:dihydroorotase